MSRSSRREPTIEVSALLAADSASLHLKELSDWGGLDRVIRRARIQKAGLAVAGFVRHVYADRPQILGLTETDYLLSLDEQEAHERMLEYCARELCCLILTRGIEPPDFMMAAAKAHGVPVLSSHLMSSTFIARLTRRLEDLLSPRATVHGVLVDILGVGLLIIGRSGVGKSEAALDLVLRGHRLVADDLVEVSMRPPDTLYGAATELHQHHMEIRGMGILNITSLFGVAAVRDAKKIEVVVELSDLEAEDYDRVGTEANVWPILGVDLPLIRIPLRAGRNIAALIEVAARNQLLRYRGYDAAREFQAKIAARIAASAGASGEGAATGEVGSHMPLSRSQALPITDVE